ncbi:peptidoglycan recognition family protein [Nonomuraea sp. NPDC050202]|uniref:peptidoglycan recognition protein family protein n=1 Tax=Nonomuraea sp. NPDC050202 TaxID=3155035 RepID=UPI0033FCB9AB
MRLVKRSEFGWGATGASYAKPTRGLVIHYDSVDQGLERKQHSACLGYWQRTRDFHRGPARQWVDIGYSYGACPHGYVFEGRGLNRAQAAQPSGNTTYYSVTLMSGPNEDPTPAQINAVRELRAWLMAKGIGPAVKGHRDFYATSCPGDRLYRLVKDGAFAEPPTSFDEEDDVAAKDLWQHELKVPFGKPDNPEWQAGNILVNTAKWVYELREVIADLEAKVDSLRARLDENKP